MILFFTYSLNSTIKYLFLSISLFASTPPHPPLSCPSPLLGFHFGLLFPVRENLGLGPLEWQQWKIKSSFCLQTCHCVPRHRASSLPGTSASLSEDLPAAGAGGNSHSVPISPCSLEVPIIQHCVRLDLGVCMEGPQLAGAGWRAEGADSQPCQRDEVGKDKTIWMQLESCPPSPTTPFKTMHLPSKMKKFGLRPPSSTSHSFLCVCTSAFQQGRNVQSYREFFLQCLWLGAKLEVVDLPREISSHEVYGSLLQISGRLLLFRMGDGS